MLPYYYLSKVGILMQFQPRNTNYYSSTIILFLHVKSYKSMPETWYNVYLVASLRTICILYLYSGTAPIKTQGC